MSVVDDVLLAFAELQNGEISHGLKYMAWKAVELTSLRMMAPKL
jgi:hypothetical protein